MPGTHPTRLVITTTITLLLSIACFLVGYFVNIWWTTENNGIKTTTGLWRTCHDYQNGTVTCEDRTDMLSFKNEKGIKYIYFIFGKILDSTSRSIKKCLN